MDRIIEKCHNMLITIEMTSGEEILEGHKIIEVKILEVDIVVVIEMTILEEVGVGLRKDNIQVILDRMIEAVAVGLDQVQEPLLIEIDKIF